MKFIPIPLFIFAMISINTLQAQDFKQAQKRYPRVREAYASLWDEWEAVFKTKNINITSFEIFLRAFKQEEVLEVWAKEKGKKQYQLITTYDFCTSSGTLGPKLKQGDGQIPEGIYYIDRFNPASTFHLSLGINYPHAADKAYSSAPDPGGDIFIHGNCVTIGCIPITDEKISALYILAVEARTNGQQNIPVHIFPFRMNEGKMASAQKDSRWPSKTLDFWKGLKPVHDSFEQTKMLNTIRIIKKGSYKVIEL